MSDEDNQPQQGVPQVRQAATAAQTTATTVEDLIESFYNFDYDQDGFIPVEDMRDLLADNGYNMPKNEIDEFMAEADPGNSGFIEYRALAALLMTDPETM